MNLSHREAFDYIRSDLFRYEGRLSARRFAANFVLNRSFRYSFWLRLTRVRNPVTRFVARFEHRRLSMKFGIQIPWVTEIGHGLYIGHHMGIVMHPSARIGNNCNLSQFTTIGSNKSQAAVIGDNVYIGPGVCIVENVRIGDGATIGAGAVVVKDVPENATVGGNPARVISHRAAGSYVTNRWPGP